MDILEVFRASPIKREIRKWRLRAPAARHIQVVNEFLNALKHFFVRRIVFANERRHVGVKR